CDPPTCSIHATTGRSWCIECHIKISWRLPMPAAQLPLHSFSGSSRACGEAYGAAQSEAITGFLHMETPPDKKRLRYAKACWDVLRRWNKPVAEFTRGMAAGARRPVEEMTLLLLHEELV